MNIRFGIVVWNGRMVHEGTSVYSSSSLETLTLHFEFIHLIKGISRENDLIEIRHVYELIEERRNTLKNNTTHSGEGFTIFIFGNECGELWQVYS